MANCQMSTQAFQHRLVEYLGDQTHLFVNDDLAAIAYGNTGRFLATVLQGIKAEVSELRDFFSGRPHAKYTAGILRTLFAREEIVRESTIAARHPSSLRGGRASPKHHRRRQPINWTVGVSRVVTTPSDSYPFDLSFTLTTGDRPADESATICTQYALVLLNEAIVRDGDFTTIHLPNLDDLLAFETRIR